MADLQTLGPIGFRGPAASIVPDHLTVTDAGVRTVQLISPGDAARSNALVGEVLDLIGEDILYITSANTSSHVSKQLEAAHFEIREIQREFGDRAGRRADRAPQRAREPPPVPAPPAVLDLDRRLPHGRRWCSSGSARSARTRSPRSRPTHGLELAIGEAARERVPVRRPRRATGGRCACASRGIKAGR